MKSFLFVLLINIVAPALAAAPTCWPDLTRPITVNMVDTTVPKIGEVVYASSDIGLVWGYTCKAADGSYYKNIAAGAWSAFPANWLYILDTAIRGTDADRKALWDKYATASAWDTRLQADLDRVWAKLPNPPVASAWKVLADPFRSDKKRLVYNVVSGKRGPATTQYVDADAPCDPAVTITEYGPVYFLSVLGNPSLVARCTKR